MQTWTSDDGRTLPAPAFWALVDEHRETRQNMSWHDGAFSEPGGCWWWPDDMTPADVDQRREAAARFQWWEDHKRDITVIPDLSDSDLIHFRLCADIRADSPVVNAATAELLRRGIRDYPIAI